MKILMATMKLDIGGAETHILELAKELFSRGIEVVVVSAGGVFEAELTAAGIRHIYAPLHSKKPNHVMQAYRILDRLLKSERFDIIHAHARIPAFLCGHLAKKYQVRFVTTAHLNFTVNALWRKISRWGERTIAVSDDIKQYLIDEYGCCSDNISVTINGINTDTYSPSVDASVVLREFGLSSGKRRIVLVSRMDTDRSEAAVQLADIAVSLWEKIPEIEILIVGDGNDFDRLKAAADRANHAAGFALVHLTGARTDINRLIAAGEIFIGVSRAALEAMAMAKPVILAGNQGYLGIFTKAQFDIAYNSNFCCRGCDETTRDRLYSDILALMKMPAAEKEALGRDCREIIEQHYSVSRMADDYLAMYEAVRPYTAFRYGDILFCGYYGFRNMGDDSLLRAMIANLRARRPDAKITVMSKNPRETAAIYGTHAINRFSPTAVYRAMKHGKLLIFGGGNLLQDGSSARSMLYYTWVLRAAKHCGMKIMVYANGIGPLHLEKSRTAAAHALSLADCITLREKDSIRVCEALGVQCRDLRLTADPAFTLKEADAAWSTHLCTRFGIHPEKKYFVVALREWKKNLEENKRMMARICDRISNEYGLIPVFLPMHDPLDHSINRAVADLCQCETVFLTGLTGSEMLGVLRHMEFVAAMRLHTLIYSTAVGVPSMGLAYDGKLQAFMETMDQPYMLEKLEEGAFLSLAAALIANRDAISRALSDKQETLRALAGQDAADALSLAGLL